MSSPVDLLLPALLERVKSRDAMAADLPFVTSALERLCEATDIPSTAWSSDPILPRIGAAGGCAAVASVMRWTSGDVRLAVLVSQFARQLSRNDSNKELLASVGGIRGLVTLAGQHMSNAKVQENTVSVFGNMSYRVENKPLIVEAGGVGTIVRAMAFHSTNEDVCEIGCIGLRSICGVEALVPACVTEGAVTALCKAMLAHPTYAELINFGSGGLLTVFQKSAPDALPPIVLEAIDAGLVDVLVQVIDEHTSNEAILLTVVRLFTFLSNYEVGLHALSRHAKVLTAVSKLFRTLSGDALRMADAVFERLVTSSPLSPETRAAVAGAGNPRGVVLIMSASLADAPTQLWGCKQLMKLGFDGRYRSLIGAQGGIDALLHAMTSSPRDESLQEAGMGALWVLSFHPDNRQRMTSAGSFLSVVSSCQSKYRERNAAITERCQAVMHMLKLA